MKTKEEALQQARAQLAERGLLIPGMLDAQVMLLYFMAIVPGHAAEVLDVISGESGMFDGIVDGLRECFDAEHWGVFATTILADSLVFYTFDPAYDSTMNNALLAIMYAEETRRPALVRALLAARTGTIFTADAKDACAAFEEVREETETELTKCLYRLARSILAAKV